MIRYKSTRGDPHLYNFSDVILKGIADDGGLFVPIKIPKLSIEKIKFLQNKSYPEIAKYIIHLFQTDFSDAIINKIVHKAYSDNFHHQQIVPLIKLTDKQYILELWHGPTSAFKDIALQIMPLFFITSQKYENKKRLTLKKKPIKYLILVATSGDTGKAALEGYKNLEGVKIIVFYPYTGVSKLQKLSMSIQEGKNLSVYGIYGNFDDAQKYVKGVFNDRKFIKLMLKKYNTILSSANSINWGRLLPQIVYYFSSYLELINNKVINIGEKIDIAVPTGNFGNILAAFYAKKMGLPVGKLICASNENNVLTEFLHTGIYNIQNRKLIKTSSPSMDILVSSNIERLLYEITQNPKIVSCWMNQLKRNKLFTIDKVTKKILQAHFYADWVSNDKYLNTIKTTYHKHHYLIDPHTAVVKTVVDKYLQKNSKRIIILCSTAHWTKFAFDVYKALSGKARIDNLDDFEIIQKIHNLAPVSKTPKWISQLKQKAIRFDKKINLNHQNIKKIIINEMKKQ